MGGFHMSPRWRPVSIDRRHRLDQCSFLSTQAIAIHVELESHLAAVPRRRGRSRAMPTSEAWIRVDLEGHDALFGNWTVEVL